MAAPSCAGNASAVGIDVVANVADEAFAAVGPITSQTVGDCWARKACTLRRRNTCDEIIAVDTTCASCSRVAVGVVNACPVC